MEISNKVENYFSEHNDWDYSKMAKTYNEDVIILKVRGIDVLVDAVKVFVPNRYLKVLDIGAGTGLCGEALKKLNFANIDGLELNKEMISIAKENNIYNNYFNEGLFPNQKTSIKDNEYDLVISAGCMDEDNHIKFDCLEEFARVLKPNGYAIIAFRNQFYEKYSKKCDQILEKMVNDGIWQKIVNCEFDNYIQDFTGRLFVYKRN